MPHNMRKTTFILFLCLQNYLLYAQQMMLWRDIESNRFGKNLIFQKINGGEKLDGHYKIAERSGAFSDLNFKEGKLHGKKTDYDSEERLVSETFYVDGFPSGKYKSYHKNGKVATSGTYKDGKQHGKWLIFDANGSKKTVESFNLGKEEGDFWKRMTIYGYSGKIIYTGSIKNKKPIGIWQKKKEDGTLIWQKNHKSETDYIEKDFFDDGTLRKVEEYKNNMPFGKWLKKRDNGNLYWEKTYISDKNYTTKEYYEDGTLKSVYNYKDGYKDGKCTRYARNGELIEENNYKNKKKNGRFWEKSTYSGNEVVNEYFDGEPTGTWYEKLADGTLKWEIEYTNPKSYTKKEYYSNGNLKRQYSSVNGKYEGDYIRYNKNKIIVSERGYSNGKLTKNYSFYDNGNKKDISNHKNGEKHGRYASYTKEGLIKIEGNYVNNNRHGIWKSYNVIKKRLSYEMTYENGIKNGLYKSYNDAEKVDYEGNYVNDTKDGIWKYYSLAGKLKKEVTYKLGEKISTKTYE